MNIYNFSFRPNWPVGGCLVILANNEAEAWELANQQKEYLVYADTLRLDNVEQINKPKVLAFESGEY